MAGAAGGRGDRTAVEAIFAGERVEAIDRGDEKLVAVTIGHAPCNILVSHALRAAAGTTEGFAETDTAELLHQTAGNDGATGMGTPDTITTLGERGAGNGTGGHRDKNHILHLFALLGLR